MTVSVVGRVRGRGRARARVRVRVRVGPLGMTIAYVVEVKPSIRQVYAALRTWLGVGLGLGLGQGLGLG